MVDLDLADILSAHLPRSVETFTIQRIDTVENISWPWRIFFFDSRVTHSDTGNLVGFHLEARAGFVDDDSKYNVVFRAESLTSVPCRAKVWVEEKLAAFDIAAEFTHLPNRFSLHSQNGRFKIVAKVAIPMSARNAELLAQKKLTETAEFLQNFDKIFLQVAGDRLNLIRMDQHYTQLIKGLNS